MSQIDEIKGKIYDEIVKHKVAERNIAILEGQLQEALKGAVQVVEPVAEEPKVETIETTQVNS